MNHLNGMGDKKERNAVKLIFVVDDERLLGEMSACILEAGGYQIRVFFNPALALAAFDVAEPKPHLLLTDYQMEPMNGMELIGECLRRQPSLRTILYSGKVEEDISQSYMVKPDRFLRKPFQPNALLELAEALLAEAD